MSGQSKHPTERGLREKNGKWEYRFNLNGQPYSRVTDLEAVPENILAGGSLPVLAKILGHADLSLLMRYVHPAQEDMDRAMEWYWKTQKPELENMLVEYEDGNNRSEVGPGQLLGQLLPGNWPKLGLSKPNPGKRRIS